MIKDYKRIRVCSLGFLLLVSCTTRVATITTLPLPESTQTSSDVVITQQSTAILPTEPAWTKTSVLVTLDATPPHASIFDNPEQVTDGKLRLSIKGSDEQCYKPGDFVPLTIAYENLTSDSLTIVDYNVVDTHVLYTARGQLFPIITTLHNERVFAPYDFMMVEVFNLNSPILHELPPEGIFEVLIKYYFPPEIVKFDMHGQMQVKPMPPGQYLFKFVYISNRQGDSWEGAISSNQIKICFVN